MPLSYSLLFGDCIASFYTKRERSPTFGTLSHSASKPSQLIHHRRPPRILRPILVCQFRRKLLSARLRRNLLQCLRYVFVIAPVLRVFGLSVSGIRQYFKAPLRVKLQQLLAIGIDHVVVIRLRIVHNKVITAFYIEPAVSSTLTAASSLRRSCIMRPVRSINPDAFPLTEGSIACNNIYCKICLDTYFKTDSTAARGKWITLICPLICHLLHPCL